MCGLFGYIAQDKNQLDLETFLQLGCENDSRGGDSVGVFIDKISEYGVEKQKLFSNFFQESKLLERSKAVHIAVGHTRKASIGTIGLLTAQPVVIRNPTTKEVEFVLLHNGTLTNHVELKKKLKDVPDHYTDSQVMAYLLYFYGTKSFKEYEGAGMFVSIDYRQDSKFPLVKFFKGGSKENSWSKVPEEERPFYILETNNGVWFSSIAKPLVLKAHGTKYFVENLEMNKVFTYHKGKLIDTEVIDRSELVQKRTTTYASGYNARNFYNDDYYQAPETHTTGHSSVYTHTTKENIKYTDTFPILSLSTGMVIDKVEFLRGLYTHKSAPITGMKVLSDYGFIPNKVISSIHFNYYFYLGVLVYGKNVLDALIRFQKLFTISDKDMLEQYSSIVYNYAHTLAFNTQTKECSKCTDFDFHIYNGKYFPLFNPTYPMEYDIKEGKINFYVEKNYNDANAEEVKYKALCEEHDKLSTEDYITAFTNNIK